MLRLFKLLRRKVAPTRTPFGVGHRRQRRPTELADQRFDLDDVGTETRQELGGVGEGLHLLDGQHADTFERSSCCGHRPRLCRSELHLEYYIRTSRRFAARARRAWRVIAP